MSKQWQDVPKHLRRSWAWAMVAYVFALVAIVVFTVIVIIEVT